jgi:hypothetical protein
MRGGDKINNLGVRKVQNPIKYLLWGAG